MVSDVSNSLHILIMCRNMLKGMCRVSLSEYISDIATKWLTNNVHKFSVPIYTCSVGCQLSTA